jgi:2-polyprenyl-3-methyl-5-hydroxy-6-metoxy-1,4-benzoquinol methylase
VTTSYIGTELEIFQHARNWKAYYGRQLRPFLGNEVLEAGAGIGATTAALITDAQKRWVCLEPDASLAASIPRSAQIEVVVGTTADVREQFDSVLYLDVLEHIEDDRGELARAAQLLRPGGHLIVLAPAHQILFTPFDKAIGHHRRYNRRSLDAVMPPELDRVMSRYLDSAGIALSLANRLLLRASMPTLRQIEIWDKLVIPISRIADPLLGYQAGKSLLEVRQKTRR